MEIIKELRKSPLHRELKEKYLMKKLQPFVAVVVLGFTLWIILMMMATAESASNLVYYVN